MKKDNYGKLLIVDDEEDICEILQFNLKNEGYDVDVVFSAEEALEIIQHEEYSLILLDVMMGGMSGFRMAEKLKVEYGQNIPIIFLTARDVENDMLTGFSLGADDYISKPFSIKEVIARIKAVLKRIAMQKNISDNNIIKIDNMVINISDKTISICGKDIQLTKKEFGILSLLVNAPNRTFAREDILAKVWSNDTLVLDRTVDVHIARLRKKIDIYGELITNRSGYGYSFNFNL